MTKGLYFLAGIALLAVIASGVEGHRASQAEAIRDSALAVGALHAQQAAVAQQAAIVDSLRADSLLALADHYRSLVHPPVPAPPVPKPDTTVRDSVRYWRDSAGVAQEGYGQALQALQARSEEAQGLRGALQAEQAVAGHLRDALTAQTTRADGLESALRKMPNACPKLLGLIPTPKVGPQIGVLGRRVDFGITFPLGC